MREQAAAQLRALYETVERLRAPGGCPWDREQTHRSLRQYLLEEAYECLEAIEAAEPTVLREELGDLLLQVFMHSCIAAESRDGDGGFDIGDVAETTRTKMVHRHPHVFGDVTVTGAEEVVVNWERLKAREKGERLSVLDGVPVSLPALAYALGVQKRPARLGFDATPAVADALAAAEAALGGAATVVAGEVMRQAAAATGDRAEPAPGGHAPGPPPATVETEDAVGELLFAVVALARRLRVNPEDALRRRARSFAQRFRSLEAAARAEGVDLHALGGEDWDRRWAATAPAAAPPA